MSVPKCQFQDGKKLRDSQLSNLNLDTHLAQVGRFIPQDKLESLKISSEHPTQNDY